MVKIKDLVYKILEVSSFKYINSINAKRTNNSFQS